MPGDTWMPDDCNTCLCTDAGPVCSKVECSEDLDVVVAELVCEGHALGDRWMEECNVCNCTVSGILCTRKRCG